MTKLQIDYWVRHAIIEEKLDVVRSFTRIEGGTFNQDRMHTHYSQADRFLVAEHGHKLIAAVSFSTAGFLGVNVPILGSAMVLRPYRRNGIGTNLCVRAIAELVADGCTPIHCASDTQESDEFVLSLPKESLQHLQVLGHFEITPSVFGPKLRWPRNDGFRRGRDNRPLREVHHEQEADLCVRCWPLSCEPECR